MIASFQDETPAFHGRIVLLLCSNVFFSVLNGTMFNVAIPDIARQFRLGPAEVSWVMTGYIIVFALAAVTYGKLADIYPVRWLITVGLLLFNAGALFGFFAAWYPLLIAGRLVQASGGGAIPALSMLVATRYFPPDRRGRVLGAVASTVALAAGVGPMAGGFIAGRLHWRYLFLISMVTLFTLPLFHRILPREQSKPERFDRQGALILGGGVSTLLAGIAQGLLWLFPLGLLLLFWFARHIRSIESPFVRPELFRNRLYRNGLYTVFLALSAVFGMFFMVPLLLRSVYRLDTLWIGTVIFPGALSAALLGHFGGRLADRKGGEAVVYAGLTLLLAGFLLLAAGAGRGAVAVALCLVVCYTGFSFLQSSLAKTVSITLPREQVGVGMGFYNLVFFTSGAFGAAFFGKMLDLAAAEWAGARLPQAPTAYSSLFLGCALAVTLAGSIFHLSFRRI